MSRHLFIQSPDGGGASWVGYFGGGSELSAGSVSVPAAPQSSFHLTRCGTFNAAKNT
jgi:hypothetical protein